MYSRARFVILILVILCVWWMLSGRDEKSVIEESLKQLALQASYEGALLPIEQLAWAKDISGYFCKALTVSLLTPQETKQFAFTDMEIRQKLVAFRAHFDQFAAALLNPEITIAKDSAEAVLLARGIGRESGREDYFKEEHRIKIKLSKLDSTWCIEKAENLDPYDDSYAG